jgi:hypothetical protein
MGEQVIGVGTAWSKSDCGLLKKGLKENGKTGDEGRHCLVEV